MKFKVSSAELLKATMDVIKAIPMKPVNPILDNFLFKIKDNVLEITASDTELTLLTKVAVDEVEEAGSIAIPASHLTDLLKVLPDQPISFNTISDNTFECDWSSGNSVLPYFPAADYPEFNTEGIDAHKVDFPANSLAEGISGTVYATADDEIRPAMNGIFFDIAPDSTTLVASDSHKLICYTTKDVKASENASFLLHKRAANILKSLIEKIDDDVNISFNEGSALFSFGSTLMLCRLVVGKYPKYRDVIPQNNANTLKINRTELAASIRRVSVCANKGSNHVKIELKDGQMEITAQDLGFGISAYEKLACDYNGAELSIGFKWNFLVEILTNMTCNDVVMKFADEKRAALIVPSEEDASSEKICGILMPIMVA
jgi:DNA polymerase-3 subunit beta